MDTESGFFQKCKKQGLNKKTIQLFQKTIYDHYKQNQRKLPWRRTNNPYHIFISEVMLQQTQVPRVLEKYPSFIKKFPSLESLASAPLSSILKEWQGMGYNRRALYLKRAAGKMINDFKGKLPKTLKELQTLPGIGHATASSILAFAFNKPTIFIETNIRAVFIHFFFKNKKNIDDSEILPLIEKTLDIENPSKWYNALMDYGVYLKKREGNPNKKSRHYAKQSRFLGSERQIRGQIIKVLNEQNILTLEEMAKCLKKRKNLLTLIVHKLVHEGLIIIEAGKIKINN